MPWPLEMALDCYDPQYNKYIWPWPAKSWAFNRHALRSMQFARRLFLLFSKNPEKWTPEELAFHSTLMDYNDDGR